MSIIALETLILPPKDDAIFKSLFTRSEPESKIILMDLVSSIIGYTITEVTILNNEPATMDIEQKQERLDLNCKLGNGDLVNIEIQAQSMQEPTKIPMKNLRNRSTYYAADLYSSQAVRGKAYHEVAPVYQITITDFNVFEKPEFMNTFKLRTAEGELLNNDFTIIFIELSKSKNLLTKPLEELSEVEMWSLFLKYVDDEKQREKINTLIQKKEVFDMASDLIKNISSDERERAHFLSRRKYENDLESNLNTATHNGILKGRQEGRQEERQEIEKEKIQAVKKGLMNEIPLEDIALLTGVPIKEIKEISKEIH